MEEYQEELIKKKREHTLYKNNIQIQAHDKVMF